MLVDDKKQSFFNLSFTYLTHSWKKYNSDADEVVTKQIGNYKPTNYTSVA